MTILTNFIKRENLDPKDTLISLKRMNRVLPNFFDEVSQVVNANMLEDPEVIIELLEVKFSLLTTINTIIFLTKVCDFYIPDPTIKEKYEELHSDLLVIYENPNLYSKASYTSIYNFINDKYITFIKPTDNHTKFRNFLLLSLLILELPLKLSLLTDIGYVGYEGCDYHDTLKFKVAIINKNNKLGFKNIYYDNGAKSYKFSKIIYGKRYEKRHKNLNELNWYKFTFLLINQISL